MTNETVLKGGAPAPGPRLAFGRPQGELTTDAIVFAALVWWGTAVTWASGGRDPKVLSVGCILVGAGLLIVRPWRRLQPFALLLPILISIAAWIVVATSATGWNGANDAASYAFASSMFVLIAAWAVDDRRRIFVIGLLLAVAIPEACIGFWAWIGSNPDAANVGTFYLKNQFAVFMLPPALLGLAAIIRNKTPLVVLGWIVFPLAAAAIFESKSRASLLLLFLGALFVVSLGFRPYRKVGLLRSAIAISLATALCWILTTSLLFHKSDTGAGAGPGPPVDLSGDLASNALLRPVYWRDSLAVWTHWPLGGVGFHGYGAATDQLAITTNTAFSHNGFLQAFAEGGLVLGIPLLIAGIAVGWFALRVVIRSFRDGEMFLFASCGISMLVLLAHSCFDFDWTYAALFGLAAILAALVFPGSSTQSSIPTRWGWLAVGVLCVSLAWAAIAAWNGNIQFSFPI